jgi:hypothetical protein
LTPAPPIFAIPEQSPSGVSGELKRAFSLFWIDPGSCANRLRVAVEALLTHQKVARTEINSRGRRGPLSLHSRIERFKAKDPDAANYLLAIKWLGNVGSHSGMDEVGDDDLLGAFELIEHVVERLYVKRENRLKKIAKGINMRKGRSLRSRELPF